MEITESTKPTSLTVTPPPTTDLTPRILTVPVPTTPGTPSTPSGLARCCPSCTHLRSSVLILMTLVAIAGLAGSLVTPLPNQQYYAAAFAILALGCMYFAKDALDHEKQLNSLATDRLLVQAQLRNTENRLETTQQNLVRIERELEEERMKIETAVGNLGGQVKDLGTENTRFKENNDQLASTVHQLKEIISEHKS